MPDHHTPLIATIALGLLLAFIFGMVAHRLRVSPLVGYLLAGVAVGPFTPGYVADQELANQLAEIGVILLMFAVGLHFSLKDLLEVRSIALPGAIGQILVATLMGMGLGWLFNWGIGGGLVFGLSLSVASTVVLIRALQERRIAETERGRIAIGWLIVEDLVMVLALVLLPAIAPALKGGEGLSLPDLAMTLAITLGKVAAFVVLMLVAGRRVIPWVMHHAAHTGSRELFRLAVYAIALGVAFGAAELFGVSFALGAFFAGMVMGESQLSQRAAEEALPLRDAFAVLFFVSVGMLFNPTIIITAPFAVLAVLAIIVVGKSVAAYLIVRAFGRPSGTALTISASLAQIGEFSFILAGLGGSLGLLPQEGRDLILAGAILSILINPFLFALVEKRRARVAARSVSPPHPVAETPMAELAEPDRAAPELAPTPPAPSPAPSIKPGLPVEAEVEAEVIPAMEDHDVVVGYGRVGHLVAQRLRDAGRPVLVFEDAESIAAAARADGLPAVLGNAADPLVLALANLPGARRLFVTVPEAFEAGQVVEQARALNPALEITARAHSDAAVEHLERLGATYIVMSEREVARRMLEHAEA
ncbi:cation:proton antiporter domain-containing protein [Muricoccus pecuniae]|uniref:CPA2 family monovalent cation:H+ antiporter-2 n=1 Tax=Muricoccus pecuniae TaxID=693023 RepID=A0A840YAB2_9PROT|nr:cation:proton antiporter [Roseomonas pecuniae]MBB5693287.1 CPA2 family monovalent cation:H+ antiporter-2 [Roseomonas pecuniae]